MALSLKDRTEMLLSEMKESDIGMTRTQIHLFFCGKVLNREINVMLESLSDVLVYEEIRTGGRPATVYRWRNHDRALT